ncbi:hypothetical protein D9758_014893 [Tetrapyrgos nigripes]|uniref:Uncharacterized protein n=1 Tax=Tetrapyrgos nigripes TaxID=182062 RepID=A0A8H5FJP0_9AGAR|nr:hypothetical protein D9758_014893 [Tetrapyrgos nigripes]
MPYSQCLLPQELFDLILDDDDLGRKDFLSCAISFKAISDPALKRVWGSMDSVFPFLRLLPNFRLVGNTYLLTSPLENASLCQFDYYLPMMKEFCCHPNGIYHTGDIFATIDDSVYTQLLQIRLQPFPSLRNFDITFQGPWSLITRIFMSSSLAEASFSFPDEFGGEPLDTDTYMSTFADAVEQNAPNFHRLTVDSMYSPQERLHVFPAISRLSNLRYFSIVETGYETRVALLQDIQSLGHLANLEELRLSMDVTLFDAEEPSESSQVQLRTSPNFFPNLKKAFLDIEAESVVVEILNSWQNTPLEYLEFEDRNEKPDKDPKLEDLLQMITWPKSLTHFDFTAIVDLNMFIQALKGVSLRFLTIYPLNTVTETDFSVICSTWPQLTVLHVKCITERNHLPTAKVFRTLCERCPKLEEVTLDVNLFSLPTLRKYMASTSSVHHSIPILTHFGFSSSVYALWVKKPLHRD